MPAGGIVFVMMLRVPFLFTLCTVVLYQMPLVSLTAEVHDIRLVCFQAVFYPCFFFLASLHLVGCHKFIFELLH